MISDSNRAEEDKLSMGKVLKNNVRGGQGDGPGSEGLARQA